MVFRQQSHQYRLASVRADGAAVAAATAAAVAAAAAAVLSRPCRPAQEPGAAPPSKLGLLKVVVYSSPSGTEPPS
jgi:hypothetical protein